MKSRTESHRRTSILIAEDEERLARLIGKALELRGYLAHVVTDGVSAINYILQSKPDLVILDLTLPRLCGQRICAMLNERQTQRHLPVVVISGCSDLIDKLQLFEMGADDYVTKPFSLDELMARVEVVLQRSPQRAQPAFATS